MKYLHRYTIGLAIVFLILGLYSGEKIFFFGLVTTTSLIFYAIVTCIWVLADFRYLQKITPNRSTKGDTATLTIEIHNDKPFIFPCIKVYYQTPECVLDNTFKKQILTILPFQQGKIEENFVCSIRGRYLLGITHIEVSDPFGLFTFSMNLHKRSYHNPLLFYIHPRVLILPGLPLPEIQTEGNINRFFLSTEESASLSDIRQYQFGDPLKKIHWKISAKLQEIYVKNYETNVQPQTFILMETTVKPVEGIHRHQIEDQMIECAVAIVHYILSNWLPVHMILYHKERQRISGNSPQDFHLFFNYFSMLSFNSPFSMDEILSMESAGFSRGESISLIIHTLTYSLFNQLCILKQSGIYPLVLFIQQPSGIKNEHLQMVNELNKREIPCFIVYTHERLDRIMEATL